jgi:RND family efflux transporter MFP subunit
LFSIEKDAYEAAYLQADALLMQARADLIEQQALADVAADEARRNPKMTYTDLSLRKPQLLSAKASVKSAEAALRIARRDLDKCDVHAPFDALIVSTDLGVGQFLAAGSPVAVLYGTQAAKVLMPIAGFDRAFLPDSLVGRPVTLTKSGADADTRRGVIRHDTGTIDGDTRMSHVVVQIDDPYALSSNAEPLPFGSFVQARFEGRQLRGLFQLPQELVINRRVWIVNDAQEMEPRRVTVIREEGDRFYIRDGLTSDDRIITTLPENPRTGMRVKVINATTGADHEQG